MSITLTTNITNTGKVPTVCPACFAYFTYFKSSKTHKSSRGRYDGIAHFTEEAPEAPRDEVTASGHPAPEDCNLFQQEQIR